MDDIDHLIFIRLGFTPRDAEYAEVREQIEHALEPRPE